VNTLSEAIHALSSQAAAELRARAREMGDDVLGRYGYSHRPSAVGMGFMSFGAFGTGLMIGLGVGMLFAPKRGSELRADLMKRWDSIRGRAGETSETAEPEPERSRDDLEWRAGANVRGGAREHRARG
jgi:YtxH-like protein